MILGLSFSHNSAACVVDAKTGELLFCCSEERFSRRKNEWGIPNNVLSHIFEHVARPEQFRAITVGESCRTRYGSAEYAQLINLEAYAVRDQYIRNKARLAWVAAKEAVARSLGRSVRLNELVISRLRSLGLSAPIEFMDHHAAHAASAYYGSPFDDALVITLDGEGDGLSGSCWSPKAGRLERLDSLPEEDSLGLFYKSITSFLGFKVNQQEGKVTGLAAYGDPQRFAAPLRRFLHIQTDQGPMRLVSKAAHRHMARLSRRKILFLRLLSYAPMMWRAKTWEGLLNQLLHKEFRDLYHGVFGVTTDTIPFALAADVAAAAQQIFEEAALAVIQRCQCLAPSANMALAGGVFANVCLNQRIIELPGVDNIYVHPGMGDEGLAFGAAMIHASAARPGKAMPALHQVFVGPTYDDKAIKSALDAAKGVSFSPATDDALIEKAVQALQKHHIIGVFRGASEYGPRALGHRSIIANPADPNLPSRLNQRLRRSTFMPFAPAVLDECFNEMFISPKNGGAHCAARFMTIALDVNPLWRERIPAVVHVDGSARPQIVCEQDNRFFHRLLHKFHAATGLGCVLNTSMNLHEEPLANTPDDAIQVLKQGAVDIMIIGRYLVTVPAAACPP